MCSPARTLDHRNVDTCHIRVDDPTAFSARALSRGARTLIEELGAERQGDMKEIEWLNEREFTVQGVKFYCSLDDYTTKTNGERFIILKNKPVLDHYAAVFAESTPRTILEFGIFQGGSPALFTLWFDVQKFVGIDLCEPVEAFDEFCRTHTLGHRIRSHYRISQTDQRQVEEIVRAEFGEQPLDLIIDDASHMYRETRRTFEIAFPLLKPGGMYVVEDWGWAHWPGSEFFKNQTALSMLVMELIMVCASRSDLISEVRVFPSFAFIRKSADAKALTNFALSDAYEKRGIELVGPRNMHLRDLSNMLLTERVYPSLKRKFGRRRN